MAGIVLVMRRGVQCTLVQLFSADLMLLAVLGNPSTRQSGTNPGSGRPASMQNKGSYQLPFNVEVISLSVEFAKRTGSQVEVISITRHEQYG